MDYNNINLAKARLKTKMGCFFGIVVLALLVISVPAWLYVSYSGGTQLKISHSPNNINIIEVVKTDDFPDPTIKINYADQSIMKTKIPDNISVEWENDYEAIVILSRQGKEVEIVAITFKDITY